VWKERILHPSLLKSSGRTKEGRRRGKQRLILSGYCIWTKRSGLGKGKKTRPANPSNITPGISNLRGKEERKSTVGRKERRKGTD